MIYHLHGMARHGVGGGVSQEKRGLGFARFMGQKKKAERCVSRADQRLPGSSDMKLRGLQGQRQG